MAVKTHRNNATEEEKRDLMHELAVMKMLDANQHIVQLLGCCTEKDPLFIILEFVDGCTLQDLLRKSRSEHAYRNLHGESGHLTARDLTTFAFQVPTATYCNRLNVQTFAFAFVRCNILQCHFNWTLCIGFGE